MNFAAPTESSQRLDQQMTDLDCIGMKAECIELMCEAPVYFARLSSKLANSTARYFRSIKRPLGLFFT